MLKISNVKSRIAKLEIANYIEASDKPCVYTYGIEVKNPTTHRKSITKKQAIRKVLSYSIVEIEEEDKVIHINEFGDNDMW